MFNYHSPDLRIRLASGINVLAGLWLLVSPWALVYIVSDSSAALNDAVLGSLIVIIGLTRVSFPRRTPSLSGINFVFGGWTLISPWVYGFTADTPRVLSSTLIGIVVMLCAGCSATLTIKEQRHRTT